MGNRRTQNRRRKTILFGDKVLVACFYCEKLLSFENATVEHLIPLAYGGDSGGKNIAIACESCNIKRPNEIPALSWKKIIKLHQIQGKSLIKYIKLYRQYGESFLHMEPYDRIFAYFNGRNRLIEHKYLR